MIDQHARMRQPFYANGQTTAGERRAAMAANLAGAGRLRCKACWSSPVRLPVDLATLPPSRSVADTRR
jgi:hypothetical protein